MSRTSISRFEFIALMAALTALDALAIDSMLPALQQISSDLGMDRRNDRQFIVTMIFFGFCVSACSFMAYWVTALAGVDQ